MGRDFAGRRWGPRPVDLDIIFYGDRHYQVRPLATPYYWYASLIVIVALQLYPPLCSPMMACAQRC